MQSLCRLYDNLSIGWKLTVGFSTLIALTVIIGAVGTFALGRYGEQAAIVAQAGTIESALLKARTEEKSFLLSGDSGHIERANDLFTQVLATSNRLASQLAPTHHGYLGAIDDGTERYRQLLGQVADTSQQRNQALEQLEINARVLEGRLSTEDKLYMAAAALKQMRRSERQFLISRDDQALQQFTNGSQRALRSIRSSFLDSAAKDEVTELFDTYIATFNTTVALSRSTHRLEADMVAAAQASLEAAAALQGLQVRQIVAERERAMTLIPASTLVVILVGAALSWLLTRAITRPIHEAVTIATQVADGDLRTEVRNDRGDELGQLLAALGTMVANLRTLVQQINGGATNIASSAEQLSAVTGQTSRGVAEQRDQTDQVATAMNQMVATVTEVARSAEGASVAASTTSERAEAGETAVNETLAYVSKLESNVDGVMASLRTLQDDTQNISTVLDVIKSVAEQTNLLALNAAIEAARAGEQGRGFAVVADEVRSLAQRTQSSASEIEQLIANLVSSAEQSVGAMEMGATLARQTLASARATIDTIQAVTTVVTEINQLNQQIATAAEEQTSVAEDINQNVTLIRDVSDQSATATDQVATASSELARLGEQLRGQVTRFRV